MDASSVNEEDGVDRWHLGLGSWWMMEAQVVMEEESC